MLAGVLLHMVKAAGPVDRAANRFPHGQGLVAGMMDHAVPFVDVPHVDAAQGAVVGGLSAALGIEGGTVQHHVPRLFVGGAGQHRGVKLPHKGVLIV